MYFYINDELIHFLSHNFIVLSVSLVLVYFVYKLVIIFIFDDEMYLDFTKSKWNKNIPKEVMYNKGDTPPENLTGWFPLCRSQEVGRNQVKGFHVLGNELVVFRASNNTIHALDAYCPHMGAYLPVGGSVVGDSIRCPFHGWAFDGEGLCSHVPGLESQSLPKAKIKNWVSSEANSIIMVWYDSNDEPPKWIPRENPDVVGLKYVGKLDITCSGNFQDLILNVADYMHFACIHRPPTGIPLNSIFKATTFSKIMTKILSFEFKTEFTQLKESHHVQCKMPLHIYLLGIPIITSIVITLNSDGPYIWHMDNKLGSFFNSKGIMVGVPHPGRKFRHVVYTYSAHNIWSRIFAHIMIRLEGYQIQGDLALFSNKKFLNKPHYCKLEGDLAEATRWLKLFHPKEKSVNGNKSSDRKYPLPVIKSELIAKRNSFHESPLNKDWMQWVFELSNMSEKMFKKVSQINILYAYAYPFCENCTRYECLVKLGVLSFVFDDHTETSNGDVARDQDQTIKVWGQFGQMLDKLEGNNYVPTFEWKPYVLGIYSVMKNIYLSFNIIQKRRLIKYWRNYMEGCIEETKIFNQGNKFDNLKQYMELRVKSIAALPSFQLIEFSNVVEISEEVWEDKSLQQLLLMAAIHCVYLNDIFSFEKELIEEDNLNKTQNIVAVISILDGLTIAESMQKLNAMIETNEKNIFELKEKIITDPHCLQMTKDYINSVFLMLGGHLKVLQCIERYN